MSTDTERPLYRDTRKIKISVVGDVSVGKTCLAARFTRGNFLENTTSTIADIMTKKVDVKGNSVLFQLWDTAGFERYRSLLPMYLRDVFGVVLVYSITERKTFDNLEKWITLINQNTTPNVHIYLAGNKKDLENKRVVATEEAQLFADQRGLTYVETSAKSGEGVQDLFIGLAKRTAQIENAADKHRTIKLTADTKTEILKNKLSSCCGK